jgi:hypothetical protein
MADNKKVLANKKLTDIVIPGSHYSNAYDIDNSKNNLIVCSGETHMMSPKKRFKTFDPENHLKKLLKG